MTTRYQSEHYEDVARILSSYRLCKPPDGCESCHNHRGTVRRFADLFAADNPPRCTTSPYNHEYHDCVLGGGFDPDAFLVACRLGGK